jgi:hypothetical protein
MARSPGLQKAMANARLNAQGLVSVKVLWCKAQGYTNRETAKGGFVARADLLNCPLRTRTEGGVGAGS